MTFSGLSLCDQTILGMTLDIALDLDIDYRCFVYFA